MVHRWCVFAVISTCLGCSDTELVGDAAVLDEGPVDAALDVIPEPEAYETTPEPVPDPVSCDLDEDGWVSTVCGGDDCDDTDGAVHPGAHDPCGDGVDQDCDGVDGQPGILAGPIVLFEEVVSGRIETILDWTGTRFALSRRVTHVPGVELDLVDPDTLEVETVRLCDDDRDAFDMVWTGSTFAAVWYRELFAGLPYLWFQSWDASGNVLVDGTDIILHSDLYYDEDSEDGPRITRAGDDLYVVLHAESGHEKVLWIMRFDETGEPSSDPVPVAFSPDGIGPVMRPAWTGSELAVAWCYRSDSDPLWGSCDLAMRRVSPDVLLLGDQLSLGDQWRQERRGALLWTGSTFLATWPRGLFGVHEADIMLTTVDAPGLEVATGSIAHVTHPPNILSVSSTWTDTGLVIAWPDDDEIVLQHASAESGLEGPAIVTPVSDSPDLLQVVWTGSHFGLSWCEVEPESGGSRVRVLLATASFCE